MEANDIEDLYFPNTSQPLITFFMKETQRYRSFVIAFPDLIKPNLHDMKNVGKICLQICENHRN